MSRGSQAGCLNLRSHGHGAGMVPNCLLLANVSGGFGRAPLEMYGMCGSSVATL